MLTPFTFRRGGAGGILSQMISSSFGANNRNLTIELFTKMA